MRSSTAPHGFYTEVEVIVRLKDRSYTYAWSTPMGLSQAYSKAPGWAKEAMREEKVKGRTGILGWAIEVRYKRGIYRQ
jgi:hypothetical protein